MESDEKLAAAWSICFDFSYTEKLCYLTFHELSSLLSESEERNTTFFCKKYNIILDRCSNLDIDKGTLHLKFHERQVSEPLQLLSRFFPSFLASVEKFPNVYKILNVLGSEIIYCANPL